MRVFGVKKWWDFGRKWIKCGDYGYHSPQERKNRFMKKLTGGKVAKVGCLIGERKLLPTPATSGLLGRID
jgi:hypothetical protein